MPDLLHVQRPVRERAPLEDLNGVEEQEHRPIVDRERLRRRRAPTRPSGSPFEERVAVGIEQRTAERGHRHRRVVYSTVDGTEERQQPRPRRATPFEHLVGLGTELHP